MAKAHPKPYKKRWSLPTHIHVPGASVYAIINSDNGKIYIGSAIKTNKRWSLHRHELEEGVHTNPYFQRAFNANPTAFQVEVVEWIPEPTKEILLDREQFWMDFFKSYERHNGYNASPKSSSCLGIKHPPEYGERISKNSKGIKWTEERKADHRLKLSKIPPRKPRGWTQEQRILQSLMFTGRKMSDETKRKHASRMIGNRFKPERKVSQYSKHGKYIQCFDSIAMASRALGIPECNIRSSMNLNNRRAAGFWFRDYSKDTSSIDIPDLYASRKRSVKMIDLNGSLVRMFSGIKEAAREMGLFDTNIGMCLKEPHRTCGGYRWTV